MQQSNRAGFVISNAATEGDVTSSRPGVFDVLGRAKWDAWNSRKGLSEEGAKSLYVTSLIKVRAPLSVFIRFLVIDGCLIFSISLQIG